MKPTCRLRRSDEGATLILVLIIVTVIAVLLGAVMANADSNIRATVQLRTQAANNYGADAAADAAIKLFQSGSTSFPCTSATAVTTLPLGSSSAPFYTTSNSSGNLNATVTCLPDTVDDVTPGGIGNPINLQSIPPAILALSTDGSEGVNLTKNGSFCILNGLVESNSVISKTQGSSSVGVGYNNSATDTTCPPANALTNGVAAFGTCTGTFSPSPCGPPAGGVSAPKFSAPTVSAVPTTTISATNTNQVVCQHVSNTYYAAFLPGLWNNATTLNSPCGTNKTEAYDWFTPGVYYFNLPASSPWTPNGIVIGGSPTSASNATTTTPISGLQASSWTTATLTSANLSLLAGATTFPGACANPAYSTLPGVELVMGGQTTVSLGASTKMDICASYVDANTKPIALYGLTSQLTLPGTPQTQIPAENGNLTTVGQSAAAGGSLISIPTNGQTSFHFEGYVYAPLVGMSLTYSNSPGQAFNWGLVVRTLSISMNGAAPNLPLIDVPSTSNGSAATYNIRYINVYTCPAPSSCPSTGAGVVPNVQVKILSTTTNGVTTVTVLGWSHRR